MGGAMDKLPGTLIAIALVVTVLILMGWGWRRRQRRDAHLVIAGSADVGEILGSFVALYVATTFRERPLERIAAPGLGFRARCQISVGTQGLLLTLAGERAFGIARDNIDGYETTNLTIDKVVERDGLVVVNWKMARPEGSLDVSSFFRMPLIDRKPFFEQLASLNNSPQRNPQ